METMTRIILFMVSLLMLLNSFMAKDLRKRLDILTEEVKEVPFNRDEVIQYQDSVCTSVNRFMDRLAELDECTFYDVICEWDETQNLFNYIY